MSKVNETRLLVQHECVSVGVHWMKMNVIQSKNGIMMNVSVSAKN